MQNTNTINGLFHIPDEGSFLKKLILSYPSVANADIIPAFKVLQEIHPQLQLIQKEHYFSLLLPTQSPGLKLEAMLITTEDKGEKLFSIYHRLHFDEQMNPEDSYIIEADAFLCLSAVIINTPLPNKTDSLASLLNYQVQEALNIEITMLCLADSDTQIVEENILPFINNTIGRYMLANTLDGTQYVQPKDIDDLSALIAQYCDVPFLNVTAGIQKLVDFKMDISKAEDMFISSFASSTLCLMLLLIEKQTSSAMLESGSFKTVKEFLLNNKELFKLRDITSTADRLGNFQQLTNEA